LYVYEFNLGGLSLRQNFQTNDYQTTSHKISNHAFFYKFANLGFN